MPRVQVDRDGFATFMAGVEGRLRQALVAAYGPTDGREATVDALSWAWEHWDRLRGMDNPVGYLFRVGQSATRRFVASSDVWRSEDLAVVDADVSPELLPALRSLPLQQRTVVVLVQAYGWTQADVAEALGVTRSTVQAHLVRGLRQLRDRLEARDVS